MRKEDHIIGEHESLREALRRLNCLSGSSMTLFVTRGDYGPVTGTLTDGDLRRAMIGGAGLDTPVSEAMHRDYRSIAPTDSAAENVGKLRELRHKGITLLPVVDEERRLTDIIDLKKTRTLLPISAVLMAGGKGERLRPMTLTKPKPLLEVDGKAIIDYNIEALAACGINDITVTTRYLAEQIHAHFAEPVGGVKVKCVTETSPLGTIGSVTLVGLPEKGDTLVMNSDLLTTISFEDMYLRHRETGADITIAVIPYQVSVPFAILTTDGERVTGIEEKPSYSFHANAGIYMFRNEVLGRLADGCRTDATDLIEETIGHGGKVVYHPVNGTWIDVGSPSDFAQAAELMSHHRNLSREH